MRRLEPAGGKLKKLVIEVNNRFRAPPVGIQNLVVEVFGQHPDSFGGERVGVARHAGVRQLQGGQVFAVQGHNLIHVAPPESVNGLFAIAHSEVEMPGSQRIIEQGKQVGKL